MLSIKTHNSYYKSNLGGYVDRVLITASDIISVLKLITMQTRIPEVGDKYTSRHGQKGVIGIFTPQVIQLFFFVFYLVYA